MNLTNEDRRFLRLMHIDLGAAALPERNEAEAKAEALRQIAELRRELNIRALGEEGYVEVEAMRTRAIADQFAAMRRERDMWRRVALILVAILWALEIAAWVLRWMR